MVATRLGSLWALLRPLCRLTYRETWLLALLLEVLRVQLPRGRHLQCPLMRLAMFLPVTPRDPFPQTLLPLTRLPRALLTVRAMPLADLRLASRLPPRVALQSSRPMRRVMSLMDTRRTCPLQARPFSSRPMRLVRFQPARRPTFRPLRRVCPRRSLFMRLAMSQLAVRLGSL